MKKIPIHTQNCQVTVSLSKIRHTANKLYDLLRYTYTYSLILTQRIPDAVGLNSHIILSATTHIDGILGLVYTCDGGALDGGVHMALL